MWCNCGGPLFDVLQSACSYNTAIQQKCGPEPKRKRFPGPSTLCTYTRDGRAESGPTDPPSRSKHKGFQKISRKKREFRESESVQAEARSPPGGASGGRGLRKHTKSKTQHKDQSTRFPKNKSQKKRGFRESESVRDSAESSFCASASDRAKRAHKGAADPFETGHGRDSCSASYSSLRLSKGERGHDKERS